MENPPVGDIEVERRRIAQGLHDSVGQTLTGLRMMIDSHRTSSGEEGAGEPMGEWVEACDRALRELREAVGGLRSEIPDRGLEGALHRLVSSMGGVRLRISGGPARLSPTGAEALLLAAREGIANARKHSVDPAIDVVLECAEGHVKLKVGSRRSTRPDVPGLGMGLGLVREVIAEAGGSLETALDDGRFVMAATVHTEVGVDG